MGGDLRAEAQWERAATAPGVAAHPDEFRGRQASGTGRRFPGAPAGALRDAGIPHEDRELDRMDYVRVPVLRTDAWLNGLVHQW